MYRERAKKADDVTDEQWAKVNSFNKDLVEEFLYESVQLSKHTLRQYRSGLRIFFTWVEEVLNGKPVYEIKKRDFLRYQNSLVRRGMSSNAIKFKRSSVSSFNKYLINFYEDDKDFERFRNYVDGVPVPAPNKVYKKVALTEEEVQMVKDTLRNDKEYQILAAFSTFYASSARRAEVVQLKKEIVTYESLKNDEGKDTGIYKTHDVRTKGKGEAGLIRPLFLDKEAINDINLWLEHRGDDDCPYIFATKRGGNYEQIHTTTVNYWFSEIISDIVGRRVNPHIIRASRSTHLIKKNDGKLSQAQKLLGHASSETTGAFYNLNEDDDSIEDLF